MKTAKAHMLPSVGQIRERLSLLFNDEQLKLVILFGSASSGHVHCKSDIDLGFLFEGPVNILELTNRVIRLLNTDDVDVVNLRSANPILKFAAVKHGKIIYEKYPGIYNEFCSLAFRMYIDTGKLRNARQKTIQHFLETRRVV